MAAEWMPQAPLRFTLALVLLATAGTVPAVQAQEVLDVRTIVRTSAPAVVTLFSMDARGASTGQGSGFFLTDGRIISNLHVIQGAAWIEIRDKDNHLLGSVSHAEALSSSADLVVLPALAEAPTGLALAPGSAEQGERIVVIGSPKGLENTVSDGIVSGQRIIDGEELIQITAPISPGSSGGPVLNARGEVIGVAVGLYREGQNLNFAVPVRNVRALASSPPGRLAFPAAEASSPTRSDVEERADFDEITLGESRAGFLDDGDLTDEGKHYDGWVFDGQAGDDLTICVDSDAFDAQVVVGPIDEGEESWFDDDGGSGTNALLRVVIPRSTRYLILVTSYEAGEQGAYQVCLQGAEPETAAASAAGRSEMGLLLAGVTHSGLVELTDPTFDDGSHFDLWHIVGAAGQTVQIDMTSTEVDAYLVVSAPEGVGGGDEGDGTWVNDDGGSGTDARITLTFPESGSYQIRAGTFEPGETGRYEIRADRIGTGAAAAAPRPLQPWEDIPWVEGPVIGTLGRAAQVDVPVGCLFAGEDGSRIFMELNENPPDGSELGVVLCQPDEEPDAGPWFVIFSFDPSGYVKDDDRDDLDADAIMESIRRGTEAANDERQKRGWGTIAVSGWVIRPYYDVDSQNLTWALSVVDESGSRTVNHSVRLLGRTGVMHADLVASPEDLPSLLPVFDEMVAGFEYLPGNRYAEWREGDKMASYGLTALVAGGAGAVAAKTGLLAKLWKAIAAGVIAIAVGLKSLWARLTGGRKAREPL